MCEVVNKFQLVWGEWVAENMSYRRNQIFKCIEEVCQADNYLSERKLRTKKLYGWVFGSRNFPIGLCGKVSLA